MGRNFFVQKIDNIFEYILIHVSRISQVLHLWNKNKWKFTWGCVQVLEKNSYICIRIIDSSLILLTQTTTFIGKPSSTYVLRVVVFLYFIR